MKRRESLKAIVLLGALVVLVGCLTGCPTKSAGKVYGALWWPTGCGLYSDDLASGGFPETATKNQSYEISSGSHYFHYFLGWTSSGTNYASYTYYVSYTVTRNPGSLTSSGADKDFTIDCYSDGYILEGSPNVATGAKAEVHAASIPGLKADGKPVTFVTDDATITISIRRVEMSDAERAKFVKVGD